MYLSRKRSLAFTTALMLVLSMFAMFPKGAFAAGAVDEYDLEIGGKKVTGTNADDILGNGEASYDPASNTLTLKKNIECNSENTEGATPCITNRIEGLTIKTVGEITLTRENFGAAIYTEKDMTLTGKLNISGGAGILVTNSTLTINDAEINAVGNSSSGITGGKFGAESKLVINNSMVKSVSYDESEEGCGAITDFGKGIELNGCAIFAVDCKINNGSIVHTFSDHVMMEIKITNEEFYDLAVASNMVTADNKDDILGGGEASYDPETNTLTLNKDISGIESVIFNNIDGLTVKTTQAITLDSQFVNSIMSTENITLMTDGLLTLTCGGCGIYLAGNSPTLTVKDSMIKIVGSWGILGSTGNESAVIENSTISVDASDFAIGKFGNGITLTDCHIKTPSGGEIINKDTDRSSGYTVFKKDKKTPADKVMIVPETFDLEVCGIKVTSSNADDILGNGEASYDPETNILSLKKNIGLPEEQGGVIVDCRIKGLTVRAENDITISRPGFGAAVCVYEDTTVTGRMTLTGGAGIMVVGCDLTVDHADLDIAGNGWGIYGGLFEDPPTKLTVNASSIRASGEEGAICGFTGGIYLNGCGILTSDCSIRDGSFSDAYTEQPTPLAEAEVTTADIYELEVAGKKVTSDNKEDILGNGEAAYDPESNTLILKKDITTEFGAVPGIYNRIPDLTVKAENEVDLIRPDIGAAIFTEEDMTLTGKINITGGAGILVGDVQLTVKDADITVSGNGGAMIGKIGGSFGINSRLVIDNSRVKAHSEEDGTIFGFPKGIVLINCGIATTDCSIKNDCIARTYEDDAILFDIDIITADIYELEVAGIKVTGDNLNDILGNGEASYDPETNTLTLKKDIICTGENTEGATPCISNRIEGLTVKAEGDIALTRENFGAAIYSEEDITLTGTMDISGGVAILVTESRLTINDADITADGGIVGGMHGKENGSELIINNSKVHALCDEEDDITPISNFGGGITLDGSVKVSPDEFETEIIIIPEGDLNKGDVNGDGEINMLDLTELQRYINGWGNMIYIANADMNNDGSVNMLDLTALQRKINGWNV